MAVLEPRAGVAVVVAGYFGIHAPGFVAEVVALAFGLAAASFFPAIILGIFTKRMNTAGAVAGMVTELLFTLGYIGWFKFRYPELNTVDQGWFGISPEGIGAVGMLVNFAVAIVVAWRTAPPPLAVQAMGEEIRLPRRAAPAHEVQA